jgi:hypothetical protein
VVQEQREQIAGVVYVPAEAWMVVGATEQAGRPLRVSATEMSCVVLLQQLLHACLQTLLWSALRCFQSYCLRVVA